MNLQLKRKFGNNKVLGVKKPKPVFQEDSDESSDDDFELVMVKKAAKVEKQIGEQQEIGVAEMEEVRDKPVEKKAEVSGPKYLKEILESSERRKNDRLILQQSNIDRNIKQSGGLVFESEAYKAQKQHIDRLNDEEVETKVEKIEQKQVNSQLMEVIEELIKTKITEKDLIEYKNRFWKRHPDLVKVD